MLNVDSDLDGELDFFSPKLHLTFLASHHRICGLIFLLPDHQLLV